MSSVPWTNYNEQSVRLTFEVHNNVNECITNVALDQMNAFDGGSSVLISLIPCRCPSLQIAQMDTTNMPRVDFSSIEQSAIQNLDSIKIKVVVKRSKAINIGLLFKFDPEQAHVHFLKVLLLLHVLISLLANCENGRLSICLQNQKIGMDMKNYPFWCQLLM